MQGIVDSSWANDILKRKSFSGFIVVYAGGAVMRNLRCHEEVSATEAEFVATFNGAKMIVVKPQPSTKINWIFSAMKRSSFQVRAICNAFFSDDKELKSDTFNYVIIGIKRCSDKGLYDIYGYLQLKSGRWTNKDLLNWVRYPVTAYLSTDRIFQRIEKEWKPHDVVLHIKSIADVLFTEGGEIRTNQPSPHQQWSCIPRSMKLLKFRLKKYYFRKIGYI